MLIRAVSFALPTAFTCYNTRVYAIGYDGRFAGPRAARHRGIGVKVPGYTSNRNSRVVCLPMTGCAIVRPMGFGGRTTAR